MDANLRFLDLNGLDFKKVNELEDLLHPSNLNSDIEFPWSSSLSDELSLKSGNASTTLNVHAPAFEVFKTHSISHKPEPNFSYLNGSAAYDSPFYPVTKDGVKTNDPAPSYTNGVKRQTSDTFNEYAPHPHLPEPVNGENHTAQTATQVSSFKLNPTVSCFVPQNIETFVQPSQDSCATLSENDSHSNDSQHYELPDNPVPTVPLNGEGHVPEYSDNSELLSDSVRDTQDVETPKVADPVQSATIASVATTPVDIPIVEVVSSKPVRRSWAQIVSSSGQQNSGKVPPTKPSPESDRVKTSEKDGDSLSIEEDALALSLGKYLYSMKLDFNLVNLQPRGLINRRNWCYINATLQALFASPPIYTMIRNLPLGPGVERGKSVTPVTDSMVKFTYEFSQFESPQEELQVGQPFQPDFIYDMLRDLKSDCLKGQQEDAEEFLSFILNGMHEEMGRVLKNYKEKNCIDCLNENEVKENGDLSDGEEEWQVIGSKHKGMITRKVVEHNTPISDLLGGQIKSFLTTSGSKTSASIQPFFTLQLDIQSESVTSVSEALKEMTLKEPIQGYTCAKTKQEVEAYSHISLQKLPPVLILHLKRFVYNKTGGCKKVMKKTDYPLDLELSRDLFSPDIKKNQRIKMYKLFAVMYHDGEEAVKGHYISDVYNHGNKTWIRCDDRQVTAVTEAQVLSHTPPRVPYLLFYQECSSSL